MRTSRFTDEQIIGIVREYEAGAKLSELCRRHNISRATFYPGFPRWIGSTGPNAPETLAKRRILPFTHRVRQDPAAWSSVSD